MSNKRSWSIQGAVNTYPPWADIRNDRQSMGQQLLNPIGNQLDDLRVQIQRAKANYYLPTAIASDIDVYYKYQLPRSFSFVLKNNPTKLDFHTPTVKGYKDGTEYEISLASNNNIEEFWYKSTPTRLSLTQSIPSSVDSHLVASGVALSFELPVIDPILPFPNKLIVTVSGANQCVQNINGLASVGTVQLHGLDITERELYEDLIYVHDDTLMSNSKLTTVSGVSIHGFKELDDTHITVTSSRLGRPFEDRMYPAAYYLAYSPGSAEDDPLYWTLDNNELSLYHYDVDQADLRVDGWVSKSTLLSMQMLDIDSAPLTNAVDLAVEPWSDRIWVVESGVLYLFNDEIPYENMKLLVGKDYDSPAVLDVFPNWVTSGEDIGVDYVWRRQSVGFQAHRSWVEKPDGTKYSLEGGSEVAYHTDLSSWFLGEPARKKIRDSEIYTLDQPGFYVYTLESKYTNGSKYIDKRIVNVAQKTAAAQFNIANVINSHSEIIAVDVDSDMNLWLVDSNWNYHSIKLHYDNMLIDINKKIIYFHDEYDSVKVNY